MGFRHTDCVLVVVVSACPGDTVGLIPEVAERLVKAMCRKASGKRCDARRDSETSGEDVEV